MKTIELEVGRLLCGQLRAFLDSCKFKGADIEYLESRGFFQRTFTIKGSDEHMTKIAMWLREWEQELSNE